MSNAILAKAAASARAVLTLASLSPQSTILEARGRRACGLAWTLASTAKSSNEYFSIDDILGRTLLVITIIFSRGNQRLIDE